ncbi:MAG: YhgN family NAAT transporter [SAR324 cluster bacterium]|nr:YhgN family NAAT transporter [SAR324 cluster bacterium]MCH2294940.1 YhgN family NAAT transporter [SAR324 cluster bacterium]MCH2300506.1 YhgN family NAAT transporter [SAR324 cluster bacterium]MCH2301828.1 YhgN family NAAT transporter [SAR324 cluster bacterium]MDP6765652.1 YhgN family NAAT transporter [SAR324 cluster bacterium]|tara:strand:+ start:192 stop:800 length:609 start_codon:yes stop_codon:yes gene_type:complete
MDLLSATLTLILIMDPLGNIPMFLSILNKIPDENRRRKILIRELLLALLVLLIFLFLGRHLLQWLNLQPQSLRIGGGIVLFLIALKMIFPPPSGGIMGQFPEGEPLLVPLAVPLLAGPSTLAMLILLSSNAPEKWMSWLLAVILAWLLTSVIMICSGSLLRLLGEKGLVAVERLMGMVLVTLSVQMLLDGFSDYLRKLLESS